MSWWHNFSVFCRVSGLDYTRTSAGRMACSWNIDPYGWFQAGIYVSLLWTAVKSKALVKKTQLTTAYSSLDYLLRLAMMLWLLFSCCQHLLYPGTIHEWDMCLALQGEITYSQIHVQHCDIKAINFVCFWKILVCWSYSFLISAYSEIIRIVLVILKVCLWQLLLCNLPLMICADGQLSQQNWMVE